MYIWVYYLLTLILNGATLWISDPLSELRLKEGEEKEMKVKFYSYLDNIY